jgi:hypothetical protein
MAPRKTSPDGVVSGHCLCGGVEVEFDFPAFWAWHDHTAATRRAHGAAYATYVGSWKKRVRITRGAALLTRFEDPATNSVRQFCGRCGSPVTYERGHAPKWVNLPRALFDERVGREARYHIGIGEKRDWIYTDARLVPLKGYPGVVWERPGRKRREEPDLF